MSDLEIDKQGDIKQTAYRFPRWDDPQPPFDWEEFRELMLRALRAPRYPRTTPIRASLYRALQRKYLARDLYAALGLNRRSDSHL